MDSFKHFGPYDLLFDRNHDGRIDWEEHNLRLDFEDFMNKRGVYEEQRSSSLDLDLDLDDLDSNDFGDDIDGSDDF